MLNSLPMELFLYHQFDTHVQQSTELFPLLPPPPLFFFLFCHLKSNLPSVPLRGAEIQQCTDLTRVAFLPAECLTRLKLTTAA